MQAKDYVYAEEIAAEWPVSAATLRYWASIEYGPKSFRVGRRRVWRRAEVAKWFAEQEAAAGV